MHGAELIRVFTEHYARIREGLVDPGQGVGTANTAFTCVGDQVDPKLAVLFEQDLPYEVGRSTLIQFS